MGVSSRLYYDDSYLSRFEARVRRIDASGTRVYLDSSAFYPESGGQPADRGTLNGIAVLDVVDEGEEVAHLLQRPLDTQEVHGELDWPRRFDHMQQHTGQHLLSAVLEDLFGWRTVSFHLGAASSTIDVEASAVAPEQLLKAEERANALAFENLPVLVTYEDAAAAGGLRKASERTGTLRIVEITGLDRSACGGTHVRATGEIGPVLIRKAEKIRSDTRIEFVCGLRATRRARADYDLLTRVSKIYSAALEEAPAHAAAQQTKLAEAEKIRRKLAQELALRNGRDRYAEAARSGPAYFEREAPALDEEIRAEAQGFTGAGPALYVAWTENPPAVLVAVSANLGVHAGNALKTLLAESGGRGGGSAQIAQGSLPDAGALAIVLGRLRSLAAPSSAT